MLPARPGYRVRDFGVFFGVFSRDASQASMYYYVASSIQGGGDPFQYSARTK